MSSDKSKKPTIDVSTVRGDSMTVKHLHEQMTTRHLGGALKAAEKPKPIPPANSADKGSASASKPVKK